MKKILGFDLVRVVAIFVVIGIYHNFGYASCGLGGDPAVRVLVYSSLGVFTFISSFLLASKYAFAEKVEVLAFLKNAY